MAPGFGFGLGMGLSRASATPPNGTPSALSLTVLSDTSIQLDWTVGSTNQDGHHIYISTDGVNYTLNSSVTGTTATKTVEGLTQATEYYFKVCDYKGSLISDFSNIVSEVTPPSILYDGNTFGWFDSFDLSTITKDSNDRISIWRDKLGSGHNLLQSVDSAKPVKTADGVTFDGVAQFLKTASSTLTQPELVYALVRQHTWTINRKFFDGYAYGSGFVANRDISPKIQGYAGVYSPVNLNATVNTWHILRNVFNGANSKLQIDETTASTGNFGTANMGGVTLGADGNNGNFFDGDYKTVIVRKIDDTTENQAKIYDFIKKKSNVVIEDDIFAHTEATTIYVI